MNLIQKCIGFPVTTAVGVILVLLFGSLSLFRLPIQLVPDVERPVVVVTTVWPGASPQEVERDIIDEQEEELKSIEGLVKMESSSHDGFGTVTLRFEVGTDRDAAMLKVSNRLDQVESYPGDVEKPVISGSSGESGAVAWFQLDPLPGNGFTGDMSTLFEFVDDFIKPEFERVPGVSASGIYGGREQEVHVIVDPARLASRHITLTELAEAIDRENRNYSGGDFDEGKRRYIVRTVGEYKTPADIENIVVAVRDDIPVYLRDVARAEISFEKTNGAVFGLKGQRLAMNIQRQAGANVIDVMAAVEAKRHQLNEELLHPRGLHLGHAWDQTGYIWSAIRLVRNNLLIGGALAIIVLMVFLRSLSSTLVVALAIPISIVGTFLMMALFNRTINVISLAGLAFATGMVVDNSIVVLENIYRHRQMGKPIRIAAYEGATQVWGAVLASTLTTIAVFAPVVLIQEEVGQLFADIAVAISCAVALSLLVAITVIPTLSARVMTTVDTSEPQHGFKNLWGGVALAARFNLWVTGAVHWINRSVLRRIAVVTASVAIAVAVSIALMPKTEYLPSGDTDFVFGLILPPPGLSLQERIAMNQVFANDLAYLREFPKGSPEAERLPGGGLGIYFFGVRGSISFVGMQSNDPRRINEILPDLYKAGAKIPGTITFFQQWGLFDNSNDSASDINIEIKGPDLNRLIALGLKVFMKVFATMPGGQAFPIPSLDLGNPELQVIIDRQRAAELGISNRELGYTVSALVDGAKASDYQNDGREIDLRVMSEKSFAHRTHLLEQMPIATPDGRLVTLGSIADIKLTSGPVQIEHRERERTITIRLQPPDEMPTETAVDIIQNQIIAPLKQSGDLGGSYKVELTGSADKLASAYDALKGNFALAIVITFLLMSALFESFLYPFVIMFTVPLAALGGFLGLALVNATVGYQPLDVLTMLGFIILVGTVVNNAILIVHQSLSHMRKENMQSKDAIREAVSNRIRPIFMSVFTSSLAMMPLIVAPGAGSELYRGLGGVVVGGLLVSTVFTLFVIPSLLSLMLELREKITGRTETDLGAAVDA